MEYLLPIQFLHTEDVDSNEFKADLDKFARVCRIVRGLKDARLGVIGTRPAAFQTMRFSEKILQYFGITVIPIDLSDVLAVANKIDSAKTTLKADEIRNYGQIPSRINNESIMRQARFSLAVKNLLKKTSLLPALFSVGTVWNIIMVVHLV
jgi:L-fucose isomerase-like protein